MSDAQPTKSGTPVHTFGVQFPTANSAVLMLNYNAAAQTGEMTVRVTRTDNRVDTAWVDTIDATADQPDTKTATAVAITPPQGNAFELMTFVVRNLPQDGPFGVNKKLCYWGYEGATYRERDALPFAAVPDPSAGTVSAKHCVWLTYAAAGTTLATWHETTGPGSPYFPWGVRVPDGVASARVEVVSGAWRHDPDPATETGAAGRTPQGNQDLDPRYQAEYRNAGLQSDRINGHPLPWNRLVALLEYVDPAAQDSDELDAATGAALPVAGALRLRLGMHDSYEWSNNQGSLNVLVHWS